MIESADQFSRLTDTTMSKSETLFEEAKRFLPGGVNSPVRAFKRVGGHPIFFKKGSGAYLTDEDDNRYIDYIGSWGALIVGHAHPAVISAVKARLELGLSFGAPTVLETDLARKICELIPSIDLIRMVSSGTEATMSAIRLARGFTGRDKIVKFEGGYHGHCDSLLVKAGSGALTLGQPDSLGVPASFAEHTLTAEYNSLEQVADVFSSMPDSIAGVIVEPVAGNMNCVKPVDGFLSGLRDLCTKYGALLIFDEVMTGFRVDLRGAQGLFGINPDLTTFGKVIGGGMPVGAFGGRADVMRCVAPLGDVYQAGTLSGNPVTMASGLATIELISEDGFFARLSDRTEELCRELQRVADTHQIPFTTNHIGGMFGCFFTSEPNVTNFKQVMACDTERFARFFHGMLGQGVNLAPSPFEVGFVSSAHGEEEIANTIRAAMRVMKEI